MRSYYRVMLGGGSALADECVTGNFIGVGYGIDQDLTGQLPDDWRSFNEAFIPTYMAKNSGKSKIAAGLACGAIWTVSKGIKKSDIVLSHDGEGKYCVAEVVGDYTYAPGAQLPHRRQVHWFDQRIDKADMTELLRKAVCAYGTVCSLAPYGDEIEKLIQSPALVSTDDSVQDPYAFALEKHLEEFLVRNWVNTELGTDYEIYEEDGESVGQQYQTDTGPIDILAISKNKRCLLVVELKKGRASDDVVGQTLRYMGYVKDELAESGQIVKGVIVAQEDDLRLRRALAMVPSIAFLRYQVSFKLTKA